MQTVTGTWPTLFHVAAAFMGDATQAIRIALENDIDDMWLGGAPLTLRVPDPDPAQTGGLPPQ
jgi:hypothetical protein